MLKTPGYITLLHMCTINQDHMMYGSWDIKCNRHIFFCHLGPFFALLICYTVLEKWHMMDVMLFFILGNCLPFKPPNNPKNEHFKKMRKITGDIIISHKCTINYDHRLYCSWDMVHDTCNFYFSFWAFFCPFTPLTAQKIKISQKLKKSLEISSFYMCVTKIMIR